MDRFRRLTCLLVTIWLLLPAPALASYKVCIDAGHGGADPGAVGCGLEEEDVTLQVAWMLYDLMNADPDLSPLMTRSSDTSVSLGARTDFSDDNGAHRFASIHCNAFNGSATGIETYCYTYGSNASFDQRDTIQDNMTATWPALTDRGGKTASYYVIKNTACPATLSELAFIDNCSNDATYLSNNAQLQAAAQAHYLAIRQSLGLQGGGDITPPTPTAGKIQGAIFADQGVGSADMSVRLPGANVVLSGNGVNQSTQALEPDGTWAFSVPAGTYTVTANYSGYWTNSRTCSVIPGGETWCSLGLFLQEDDPPPVEGMLRGVIFEEKGVGTGDMSIRLTGAGIHVSGPGYDENTYAMGLDADYLLAVPPGQYIVSASKSGYWANSRTCTVTAGTETWCSIGLFPLVDDQPTPPNTGALRGIIYQDQGNGPDNMSIRLTQATVVVAGDGVYQTDITNSPEGIYSFALPTGTYTVKASYPGHYSNERTCTVMTNQEVWCSIGLIEGENDPSDYTPPTEGGDVVTQGDQWSPGEADIQGHEPPEGEDVEPGTPNDPNDPSEQEDPGTQPQQPGTVLPGDDGPNSTEVTIGNGCQTDSTGNPSGLLIPGVLLAFLFALRRRRGIAVAVCVLAMGTAVSCQDKEDEGTESARATLLALTGSHSASIGEAVALTSSDEYSAPVFSPDGSRILFSNDKKDALFVIPAEGGELTQVVQATNCGQLPRWGESGETVEFRVSQQRTSDVPARAVSLNGSPVSAPRNRHGDGWIQIIEDQIHWTAGEESIRLSPDGDRYCCAQRSLDGRWVLFQGVHTGLYLFDLPSKTLHPLGQGNHGRFDDQSRFLTYQECKDDGQMITGCHFFLADLRAPIPFAAAMLGVPAEARNPSLSPNADVLVFDMRGGIWTAPVVLSTK